MQYCFHFPAISRQIAGEPAKSWWPVHIMPDRPVSETCKIGHRVIVGMAEGE